MEAKQHEASEVHKKHVSVLEHLLLLQRELKHSVQTLERELKNYSDFIVHCTQMLFTMQPAFEA